MDICVIKAQYNCIINIFRFRIRSINSESIYNCSSRMFRSNLVLQLFSFVEYGMRLFHKPIYYLLRSNRCHSCRHRTFTLNSIQKNSTLKWLPWFSRDCDRSTLEKLRTCQRSIFIYLHTLLNVELKFCNHIRDKLFSFHNGIECFSSNFSKSSFTPLFTDEDL